MRTIPVKTILITQYLNQITVKTILRMLYWGHINMKILLRTDYREPIIEDSAKGD